MTSAFDIFDATDVPVFAAQMNVWGGNLETAVAELRGAILMQGAELEAMRNGLARDRAAHRAGDAVRRQGGR